MRYPNLELIEYKAENAIREKFYPDKKDKYWFKCIVDVFEQVWGSTATGFGGCGVSAITREYTTVCCVIANLSNSYYLVFFGNELAYIIQSPNDKFFDDLKDRNMQPQSKAHIYHNNDNEAQNE